MNTINISKENRETISEYETASRIIVRQMMKEKKIPTNGKMRKHVTTWGILLEPYVTALSQKYGKAMFSDKAVIDYCCSPREKNIILDTYPELRDMVPTLKECVSWMKREMTLSNVCVVQ